MTNFYPSGKPYDAASSVLAGACGTQVQQRPGRLGSAASSSFAISRSTLTSDENILINFSNITYGLRPLNNVQFWPRSRKAKISTAGIYVIFRGLKFEPDTEIGQKGTLFKGLKLSLPMSSTTDFPD